MNVPPEAAEEPWAVRLTRQAVSDIQDAWQHFADTTGEGIADAWQEGLEAEIVKLGTMPWVHPLAEESPLFREDVHRLLYRRARGGPAYRILYALRRPQEDAPTVLILHIRHGAKAPMTADEAKEINSGV